jgi:SAM-dependent methyltransferase
MTKSHVAATQHALERWNERRPHDCGDPITPIQNISTVVARQQALMRVLHAIKYVHGDFDTENAQVLDVGCASGYGLKPFLIAGFRMDQLHGVDFLPERIELGKRMTPGMDLRTMDATAMTFESNSFDLVCEQFCFCHVPDDGVKAKIAAEMMRVSRRYILIHDWRLGSDSRELYGVSQAKIRKWFPGWKVMGRHRSQLWPPIGRPLSSFAWPLYDMVRMFSPLVGSWMTVLHR